MSDFPQKFEMFLYLNIFFFLWIFHRLNIFTVISFEKYTNLFQFNNIILKYLWINEEMSGAPCPVNSKPATLDGVDIINRLYQWGRQQKKMTEFRNQFILDSETDKKD